MSLSKPLAQALILDLLLHVAWGQFTLLKIVMTEVVLRYLLVIPFWVTSAPSWSGTRDPSSDELYRRSECRTEAGD